MYFVKISKYSLRENNLKYWLKADNFRVRCYLDLACVYFFGRPVFLGCRCAFLLVLVKSGRLDISGVRFLGCSVEKTSASIYMVIATLQIFRRSFSVSSASLV